jgi:hypothetical protein
MQIVRTRSLSIAPSCRPALEGAEWCMELSKQDEDRDGRLDVDDHLIVPLFNPNSGEQSTFKDTRNYAASRRRWLI